MLYPRILNANEFNHLDVEWMYENEKGFEGVQLSKEDLVTLQNIVEVFKQDNSIAKMYEMMNHLPNDRRDLKELT